MSSHPVRDASASIVVAFLTECRDFILRHVFYQAMRPYGMQIENSAEKLKQQTNLEPYK